MIFWRFAAVLLMNVCSQTRQLQPYLEHFGFDRIAFSPTNRNSDEKNPPAGSYFVHL